MMIDSPDVAPRVVLEARAEVAADQLRIHYRLENKGPGPVYVWDQLTTHDDDGLKYDDKLAYVCWQAPRTVRVARALLRLPTDFRVGKKSEPFVREVAAGGAIEGDIALARPIREFNPYYADAARTEPVECDEIQLIIGWVEVRDDMKALPRKVRGEPFTTLAGSWSPPHQRLARATLKCEPILLEKNLEKFDRRLPLE